MSAKPEYSFGDIYLVRFHPSFGAEFKKYRTAVIVSEQTNVIDYRFTTIAPLTTHLKTKHPDFEILVSAQGKLEQDSLLLSWYLRTIDTRRLEQKIGQLNTDTQTELKLSFSRLFS